jgi:hypothetical protein
MQGKIMVRKGLFVRLEAKPGMHAYLDAVVSAKLSHAQVCC